jgi:hypothetical protein
MIACAEYDKDYDIKCGHFEFDRREYRESAYTPNKSSINDTPTFTDYDSYIRTNS